MQINKIRRDIYLTNISHIKLPNNTGMSSLIVLDDNNMDRRITKYNLVKYPEFNNVSYDDGLAVIDYIKEQSTDKSSLPDIIF